jgi:hypothetical protein
MNMLENKKALFLLKAMWISLGLIMAIDIAWIWQAHLGVAFPGVSLFVIGLLAFSILVSWISARQNEPNVFMFTQAILLSFVSTLAIGWFCYLSNRLAMPLVDADLIYWDHLLGFDWKDDLAFVIAHPTLQYFFRLAYISEAFTTFFIMMLLALMKRSLDLQRLLMAMLLGSFICTVVAALWPAVGGYIFYDIHPEAVLQYPAAGRMHEHNFLGMRDHSITVLTYPMQGLVTFPSFHAAVAVFLMWISRQLRGWFWPILILSIMILLATPVHGGHYLSDTIGGVAVALLVIAIVSRLLPPEVNTSSKQLT